MIYELGYTPKNLKMLVEKSGMTYQEIYSALGCSRRSFYQWLVEDIDDPRYVAMHPRKWRDFLNLLKERGISI